MIELRPYQRAAIDAIYAYFGRHAGHPLIAIPTSGGKSMVMAAFMREVFGHWPAERLLVITHVKELIAQNYAEPLRLWPEAPWQAGLPLMSRGCIYSLVHPSNPE